MQIENLKIFVLTSRTTGYGIEKLDDTFSSEETETRRIGIDIKLRTKENAEFGILSFGFRYG